MKKALLTTLCISLISTAVFAEDGPYTKYNPDGTIAEQGTIKDNKKVGKLTLFEYDNGKLEHKCIYSLKNETIAQFSGIYEKCKQKKTLEERQSCLIDESSKYFQE